MAYFLKITNYKKGQYLQIYDSFRDPETKKPKNQCYRTLGYLHDLQAGGIEDPIAYYREEIRLLNLKRKREKAGMESRTIDGQTPLFHIGSFLMQAVWRFLAPDEQLDALMAPYRLKFSFSTLLRGLVMAQACGLNSQEKAFQEALSRLWKSGDWDVQQILTVLRLCGQHANEISAIFTQCMEQKQLVKAPRYFAYAKYSFDLKAEIASKACYEQTSPWLEGPGGRYLDQNDGSLQQSPHSLFILSSSLLLDEDRIVVMSMLDGKENGLPLSFDQAACLMKEKAGMEGGLIRVSDRLLNQQEAIRQAQNAGDGVLYQADSRFFDPEMLTWLLDAKGWQPAKNTLPEGQMLKSAVFDRNQETGLRSNAPYLCRAVAWYDPEHARRQKAEILEQADEARVWLFEKIPPAAFVPAGRYVQQNQEGGFAFNEEQLLQDLQTAGIRLIVSSRTDLAPEEIIAAYADLASLRDRYMGFKNYLDLCDPWAKSKSRIQGLFVIGCLGLMLRRVMQIRLLHGQYSEKEIDEMLQGMQAAEKLPGRYINLSASSPLLKALQRRFVLPLLEYELSEKEIDALMHLELKEEDFTMPDQAADGKESADADA